MIAVFRNLSRGGAATRWALPLAAARLLLVLCALAMASLTVPALQVAAVSLLGLSLIAPEPATSRRFIGRALVVVAWLGSLAFVCEVAIAGRRLNYWDPYFAVQAWVLGGAAALRATAVGDPWRKRGWKVLAMVWAGAGEAVWLGFAYLQDLPGAFYAGLLIFLFLILVTKLYFRLPRFGILVANTFMLLVVGLPVADWATRPPEEVDPHPEHAGTGYLYSVAKEQPHAFLEWWGKYNNQYQKLMRDLFIPDPKGKLPYLLRTNRETTFFESRVHINSLGFRGREMGREKGGAYRIVALGESNTFGFTLTPEHKPWPEFLEDLIRQRLKPDRPVEVINAGLPHHGLGANLYRLRTRILALKPDMIISYHGWNEFRLLYSALPPVFEKHLPVFKRRPLPLLAECEYRVKLIALRRRLRARPVAQMPDIAKMLRTPFADHYRELISLARTNHIRLVLANYSMAVNAQSPTEVIEFYREAFPAIYPTIQVNVMNTLLLEELARQHQEVRLVDTHPHLDGEHDKFIDLVHFAPAGDRQMAETLFEGIQDLLQADLGTAGRVVSP